MFDTILTPSELLLAFAAPNLAAFALFGLDKSFAKSTKRRISERTLLAVAALAASPGALLGMVLFNHKTSKPLFRYGVPTLFAIHAAVSFWLAFG